MNSQIDSILQSNRRTWRQEFKNLKDDHEAYAEGFLGWNILTMSLSLQFLKKKNIPLWFKTFQILSFI